MTGWAVSEMSGRRQDQGRCESPSNEPGVAWMECSDEHDLKGAWGGGGRGGFEVDEAQDEGDVEGWREEWNWVSMWWEGRREEGSRVGIRNG